MNAAVELQASIKPQRKLAHAIHPTGNRVIIQPVEVEEKTASGLVLAETTRKHKELLQSVGYVAAIGPTAFQKSPFTGQAAYSIGDLVMYGTYAGQEFDARDVNHKPVRMRIMNDSEVTALVDNPLAIMAGSLGV